MDKLVFVYGTLKRKKGNSHVFGDSSFLFNATTVDQFCFTVRGIPFMTNPIGENVAPVTGEVWRVTNPNILNNLDRLEGHPDWYKRTEVRVTDDTGNYHSVEAYIYQEEMKGDPPVDGVHTYG